MSIGFRSWSTAVLAVCIVGLSSDATAQGLPALDAPGFQKNRDYFSEMPFENIDTLGGGLVLTFTDLVLPGNAGRELRFRRSYNSKSGQWTFGIDGIALYISDPQRPAYTPDIQELTPALLMSDGNTQKMAWYVSPNVNIPSTFDVAISSTFWRYNRNARTLSVPNGDTCTYQPQTSTMLRVERCTDIFGNDIDFTWTSNPARLIVEQDLGASSRPITIELSTGVTWLSMSYEGRQWNYVYDGVTGDLASATPPEGPGWQFSHTGHLLEAVTTPNGGVIEYVYDTVQYDGPTSLGQYFTTVVAERHTSGRDIGTQGSWM